MLWHEEWTYLISTLSSTMTHQEPLECIYTELAEQLGRDKGVWSTLYSLLMRYLNTKEVSDFRKA